MIPIGYGNPQQQGLRRRPMPMQRPGLPLPGMIPGMMGMMGRPGGYNGGGLVARHYQDGGKLSDILETGANPGLPGVGGNIDAQQVQDYWNQPASQELINQAMDSGYRLRTPAEGSPLQSSGPQGGWYPSSGAEAPPTGGPVAINYPGSPPGGSTVSDPNWNTNNWRLLPQGYNNPNYIVRGGEIIDRRILGGGPSAWAQWFSPGISGIGEGGGGLGNASGTGYPALWRMASGGWGTNLGGWPGSIFGAHILGNNAVSKRGGLVHRRRRGGGIPQGLRMRKVRAGRSPAY